MSGACVTSRSDNTAEKIYTRWRCHRPLCSPVFADGGLTRRCAHHGYTAVSVNDTHTEMCVCRHISYQSHTKTAKAFPACPLCSEPCIKAHYIFFLTRHLIRERRRLCRGASHCRLSCCALLPQKKTAALYTAHLCLHCNG